MKTTSFYVIYIILRDIEIFKFFVFFICPLNIERTLKLPAPCKFGFSSVKDIKAI